MKTTSARRNSSSLERKQLGRRALESRQLVHAVVDDGVGVEMAAERQRHRRVVPEDAVLGRKRLQETVDQLALRVNLGARAESVR